MMRKNTTTLVLAPILTLALGVLVVIDLTVPELTFAAFATGLVVGVLWVQTVGDFGSPQTRATVAWLACIVAALTIVGTLMLVVSSTGSSSG